MSDIRAVFSDDMIERASAVLDCSPAKAREALEAAFTGVPVTNYGIGLALQFFDYVICVKDRPMAPAAGVYCSSGEGQFDSLPHEIEVNYGYKPTQHITRIALSKLPPPQPKSDSEAA